MPIYSFSALSLTTFLLVWKIDESLAALYSQLHPLFRSDFSNCGLSSRDKMRQSLAVRLALGVLLKRLGLPILKLSKDGSGRPILEHSENFLSFSHTRYLAAVALSSSFPVGIDIEIVGPKLGIVQEKILTEAECKHANTCFDTLAVYWCAKEALYKLLQVGTFKHIFIEPFHLQPEGSIVANLDHRQYSVGYKRMEDGLAVPHFFAFCEDHLR